MSQNVFTQITSAEFGKLFEQYKPQFVMVARSYVRDAMVAEDLVMDSFISFWENRNKTEIVQNIPCLLYTSRCV